MRSDLITYWARQRPNAIALIDTSPITYRAFDEAINKVAASLRSFCLPGTGLVAVQMGNLHGLYLVERALDRMGLTSVILPQNGSPEELLDLLHPDLFLTYQQAGLAAHPNAALISLEWLASAVTGPFAPPPGHRPSPDDIVRVVISSGTTGVSKKIPITRDTLERLCRIRTIIDGLGQSSRLLLAMGPQTISGLVSPMTFWTLGATVMIYDPRKAYEEILRLRPSHVYMATAQLEALLREIPDEAAPIAHLHVSATGSQVSRTLARQVLRRLSEDFWINYGSTELNRVATGHAAVLDRHERAVGYVVPGREVEVVNAEGAPLAANEVGVLRMRGEGLFSGYLGDDKATSSALKDGWFYPGDRGSLMGDGLLIIEGRIAELMNLGGVKIDPGAVDELAKTCAGVRDVAAFAVPDEVGLQRPWIAIVPDEGFETARLVALLRSRWPGLGTVRVATIDAIPRNAMLKVERHKLLRMVLEVQGRTPGATQAVARGDAPD